MTNYFTPPTITMSSPQLATYAANTVIGIDQQVASDVEEFLSSYRDFWGVKGSYVLQQQEDEAEPVKVWVAEGSIYTVEEMNLKFELIGQALGLQLLTLAAAKRNMIQGVAAYLGVELLPAPYLDPAYDYVTGEAGITFTALKPIWEAAQAPEEELTTNP